MTWWTDWLRPLMIGLAANLLVFFLLAVFIKNKFKTSVLRAIRACIDHVGTVKNPLQQNCPSVYDELVSLERYLEFVYRSVEDI